MPQPCSFIVIKMGVIQIRYVIKGEALLVFGRSSEFVPEATHPKWLHGKSPTLLEPNDGLLEHRGLYALALPSLGSLYFWLLHARQTPTFKYGVDIVTHIFYSVRRQPTAPPFDRNGLSAL